MGTLSIVVCGAPLAARAQEIVAAAQARRWDASLVVTAAARAWVPEETASEFRAPDDPKPPRPDAVLVLPLTFNTGNKLALGIADSRPMSLLAETLGAGKPIVVVPMVNESLWGHPRWGETLKVLGQTGVEFVDPASGEPTARPIPSGSGDAITVGFEPAWALDRLGRQA